MAQIVYKKSPLLTDTCLHYCPGCSHGVVHKLVAESLDELGLQDKAVGIAPVGCSVYAYNYFNVDMIEAAHGRAPAVATGVKRVLPEKFVFTYQGDGDLASIGAAEIIHAAARGENISVVFINNAIYGMTGGQMAPTSLLGQNTTTSPYGRSKVPEGYPVHVAEMLATIEGAYYIERTAVHNVSGVRNSKKAIKKAFEYQRQNKGFSLVEILSVCPTNWDLTPLESLAWLEEKMIPEYPLGVMKEGRNDA